MFKKVFLVLAISATMFIPSSLASSYCSAVATGCGNSVSLPVPPGGSCISESDLLTAFVSTFDSSGAWVQSRYTMCPFFPM